MANNNTITQADFQRVQSGVDQISSTLDTINFNMAYFNSINNTSSTPANGKLPIKSIKDVDFFVNKIFVAYPKKVKYKEVPLPAGFQLPRNGNFFVTTGIEIDNLDATQSKVTWNFVLNRDAIAGGTVNTGNLGYITTSDTLDKDYNVMINILFIQY